MIVGCCFSFVCVSSDHFTMVPCARACVRACVRVCVRVCVCFVYWFVVAVFHFYDVHAKHFQPDENALKKTVIKMLQVSYERYIA